MTLGIRSGDGIGAALGEDVLAVRWQTTPKVCVDLLSCFGSNVSVDLHVDSEDFLEAGGEEDVLAVGVTGETDVLFLLGCAVSSLAFFSMAANLSMASLKGFSLSISGEGGEALRHGDAIRLLMLLVDSRIMDCTRRRLASVVCFLRMTTAVVEGEADEDDDDSCSDAADILGEAEAGGDADGGGLSHTELDDEAHDCEELTPDDDGVRLSSDIPSAESSESCLAYAFDERSLGEPLGCKLFILW